MESHQLRMADLLAWAARSASAGHTKTMPEPDLFAEDFDKPCVFRCFGGNHIGRFKREAKDDDPLPAA